MFNIYSEKMFKETLHGRKESKFCGDHVAKSAGGFQFSNALCVFNARKNVEMNM